MSMESANTALADSPEQRPMKSMFGQPTATREQTTAENDANETSGAIPLRERDKTERFARDINTKIDALEEQLGRSTSLMERSQEMVRMALEELRERIMGVRHDTEEKLAASRENIEANRAEIESQRETLAHSREEIQQHRDAIRAQHQELEAQQAGIEIHRKTLELLGENLSVHGVAIAEQNERIDHQQAHLTSHAEQIETLDNRHIDLHQALLGLSQEHDTTATKVDVLADQLYDTGVQIATHRNQTQKHFRVLTGALVGTSVLTLSLFGYFLFNPIAASTTVESQLASLNSDMAQQRDATVNMSGELHRIGTGLTILEGNVSQMQGTQSTMQTEQQASREELNRLNGQLNRFETTLSDLRARLQRAVGSRRALPVPALTVHDSAWLTKRPSSHYVIQLAGAHEYDSLVQFVNKNTTALRQHPLSFAVASHQGQAWHNLMYGDFANLQDAKAALAALPPALRAAKPWIRPMSTVQRNVR